MYIGTYIHKLEVCIKILNIVNWWNLKSQFVFLSFALLVKLHFRHLFFENLNYSSHECVHFHFMLRGLQVF
jgi:hypothetical protein